MMDVTHLTNSFWAFGIIKTTIINVDLVSSPYNNCNTNINNKKEKQKSVIQMNSKLHDV